jgi:hypothetical protein
MAQSTKYEVASAKNTCEQKRIYSVLPVRSVGMYIVIPLHKQSKATTISRSHISLVTLIRTPCLLPDQTATGCARS